MSADMPAGEAEAVAGGTGASDRGVGRRLTREEKHAIGTDIQRRVGVKTSRDEPLARFTTMRVGGLADLFAEVHNLFELRGIVRFARSRELPLFLIGRGSDLVISDMGIGGIVVLVRATSHRIEDGRLVADAGLPMAKAATVTKVAGLAGLEFGLAIPGTVGGAVWANAGAHESDVKACLESVSIIAADGKEVTLASDELGLAYRDSRFKHAPPNASEIVMTATFRLQPADPTSITSRLDEIRRWRQAHQPLGRKSAGSFFRNPEGDSSGQIIDELGLKGHRVGGASVSEKHANFIINDASASASDVRQLGEEIRDIVRRERGVDLRFEVEFVGDWSGETEAS
jgi:UDP-N-acetylmuramate dehydrogenase